MRPPRPVRWLLRILAIGWVGLLILVPAVLVVWRSLEPGPGFFWRAARTPAAISAFNLTLLVIAVVVPFNVVFGIATALALVRGRFPGRRILQSVVDLPFAVSPVVVGVALISLWGADGWFGALARHGLPVIYSTPGILLVTAFVTLPFVVRETEPVLRELGTEQEQAAATLGATPWQVFWRITLPSMRWGVTYGAVLTVARALGEYGAVLMVSSNLPGVSQTLTLLVHTRYSTDNFVTGAYAASTVLMALAVVSLLLGALVNARKATR